MKSHFESTLSRLPSSLDSKMEKLVLDYHRISRHKEKIEDKQVRQIMFGVTGVAVTIGSVLAENALPQESGLLLLLGTGVAIVGLMRAGFAQGHIMNDTRLLINIRKQLPKEGVTGGFTYQISIAPNANK